MINNESATKKRHWFRMSIVGVIILLLLYIYYPISLTGTMGIKGVTADDISGMSLHIALPSPLPDIDGKEIRLDNITDKAFIEDILAKLSNHSMRKRRFTQNKVDYFPINDFTRPSWIDITIHLKETNSRISISHNPKYLEVGTVRYKLYGDGIDTKGVLKLAREKVEK